MNYYITSLNQQQLTAILDAHKNQEFETVNSLYNINGNKIELIGTTKNINGNLLISAKLIPYIDSFTTRKAGEKEIHYRDYSISLTKQKDKAWLINLCQDARSSWNTINKVLNKPSYCVIWGDSESKKYENVIGQI
jgi:hypothetical protein